MRVQGLVVGGLVALGLVVAVSAARAGAGVGQDEKHKCCSAIKIDLKTRRLTVRDPGTGATYVCDCAAKDEEALKALKVGDQLEIDVTKMTKLAAGKELESTAQAATCGGWNGPRTTNTRPTAPTRPPGN